MGRELRLYYVDPLTETPVPAAEAEGQGTALCQAHATGLVRLAMLMLDDQSSAEDVVQHAFLGLYRRRGTLNNPDRAVAYARSSVLNGCRDALRGRARKIPAALLEPNAESAEARVLLGEEHRKVLAALRRLPSRQREAVVLRYCLNLPEHEVAEAMNLSRDTVKSASHRGLAALARILRAAETDIPGALQARPEDGG